MDILAAMICAFLLVILFEYGLAHFFNWKFFKIWLKRFLFCLLVIGFLKICKK